MEEEPGNRSIGGIIVNGDINETDEFQTLIPEDKDYSI
jgi:hypothetical protein